MAFFDVMVDIEALSRKQHAVVLTIGAVRFDRHGELMSDPFHLRLPAQEQIDAGGHVEFDTVRWWMEQSENARQSAFYGPMANSLAEGLNKFSRYLKRISIEQIRLWSNGPSFDSAILQNAYARAGLPWPLRYDADRDCRTLFEMAHPQGDTPFTDMGVAHNALDDAKRQAAAVQACMRRLGQGET